MVSQDFRRQLEGYGLTTANILFDQACRDPRDRWRVPAALRTEVGLSDVSIAMHSSSSSIPSPRPLRAQCATTLPAVQQCVDHIVRGGFDKIPKRVPFDRFPHHLAHGLANSI